MSLTPMIDVVFLLLVFFMLAARFDQTAVVPITLGGGGAYTGPPRLVDVTPNAVLLNGVQIPQSELARRVLILMDNPTDTVVFRARGTADVQRIVDVMSDLRQEGLTALTLVE
jgi:biopolymer transport protein ExbD